MLLRHSSKWQTFACTLWSIEQHHTHTRNTHTRSLPLCLPGAVTWRIATDFPSSFGHQNCTPIFRVREPTQVSLTANFSCQWWRACTWIECNERRMSRNKRQDGVEGYIITSTKLNPLFSSQFFFSTPLVLAQICHIGRGTPSAGWLLKVVYWGWPCLSFNTTDYGAIHQRELQTPERVCSMQAKFGKKVLGGREKMRRSCHDEWAKRTELIRGGTQLFTGNCKVVILMGYCYCSYTHMEGKNVHTYTVKTFISAPDTRTHMHISVSWKRTALGQFLSSLFIVEAEDWN